MNLSNLGESLLAHGAQIKSQSAKRSRKKSNPSEALRRKIRKYRAQGFGDGAIAMTLDVSVALVKAVV